VIESPFAPAVSRPEGNCLGCMGPPSYRHCQRCTALERWHTERANNIQYARAAVAHSLALGEAPYASHILYTQLGILDDTKPEERRRGIEAGLAWGARAELCAVYTDRGISPGMKIGIERHGERGLPIEYRSLYREEAFSQIP